MFSRHDDDWSSCPDCGYRFRMDIGPGVGYHECSSTKVQKRGRVRSHPVPTVGDTVRLNRHGIKQIFGGRNGLSHMMTLAMKITRVDSESLTSPEETFTVAVDNQEINQYLIDHWCFDVVRP